MIGIIFKSCRVYMRREFDEFKDRYDMVVKGRYIDVNFKIRGKNIWVLLCEELI